MIKVRVDTTISEDEVVRAFQHIIREDLNGLKLDIKEASNVKSADLMTYQAEDVEDWKNIVVAMEKVIEYYYGKHQV